MTKSSSSSLLSLVDRGANGGVAGSDVRVIETHANRKFYIHGVENHQISTMPLGIAGGVTATTTGEVIVIMHQHACHGKNKTIYSSPQIEHYKNIVDDCSIKVGGGQHITTLDECKNSMPIRADPPYTPLRPHTDKEWPSLPYFMITLDVNLDHTCLDYEGKLDNEEWFDTQSSFPDGPDSKLFNDNREHRNVSDYV